MDLSFDIRQKLKFDIFPNVEFAYTMINNTFTPYIGVNGKLKQNNFRTLAQENQWIFGSHEQLNEATVFSAK